MADRLEIKITAKLKCTNGTEVTVSERSVELRVPGARGGQGSLVTIPIAEWDKVDDKVRAVRSAIEETKTLAERVNTSLNAG